MANLLSNTTIGGYQSIHTGNIGSYAITSIPTSFSSITVTSSFDTASNDVYASMRVIRNNASSADGMYIGYGNSGSGITRIFGGGSTTGALEKYATYTYEPGSFRAPIFYDSADTSYYLDPNSTSYLYHLILSGNSYFRPNTWIQFDGNYGLYWPNHYGLHLYPNNSGSYGALQINGTKGGWAGIHFNDSANTLMANSNESGFHRQGNGWQFRWTEGTMYVHRSASGGGTAYTVLDTGNYNSFSIPTKQYIWSRGENLLTNGTALLGNNTNFSSFTFDGSQAYSSSGSFRYTGQYHSPNTDELMPINAEKRYRLDFWAKTANGQGAYYAYLNFFDVDGNAIMAPYHMYYPNTLTTLAQTLNPGDTVAYLTSVANWENGGTAGVNTHIRSFIFWNYTNSFGYTYPPQTYSRNWYSDAWNPGAINSGNNTITLRVPWSGPSIPAGTQVSNGSAGGTFKYIALGYTIVPTTWTNYVGIMDGIDYSGSNAGGKFPPGTAAAKLGFLTDYNGSGDTIYLANLFVGVDNDYPIYDRWTGNTRIEKSGAFYGTIFYDSNNGGYYLDPSSTSNLYRVDAASQMRAPIFYDSQDTNYYLDPNSTSRLVTVNADTLRSYGNVYTDGNYGHGLVGLYSASRYQGVFAMGDAYKLSADGTSTGTLYGIAWTHTNVGGQSKSGLGHQALFMDNGNTQTAIGTGIWTNGLITTTSYGTSANWKSAYDWGNHASAGYLRLNTWEGNSYIATGGAHYGTIFYDSNDSAYYIDPNSSSRVSRLWVDKLGGIGTYSWVDAALTTSSIEIVNQVGENGSLPPTLAFHWYGDGGPQFRLAADTSNILYLESAAAGSANTATNSTTYFNSLRLICQDATGLYVNGNGVWHRGDFSSANISNWNTAYSWGNHASAGYVTSSALSSYVPLSGATLIEGNYFYFRSNMGAYLGATNSPSLQAFATGGNAAFMSFHRGGNYAVNFGLDSDNVMRIGGWSAAADRWVLDMSGNNTVAGSFRAPIFYDSQDTNYYVDPNSTSNLAASYIGRVLINYDGTDTWFRMQSGNRMRITTTGGTDFIIPNTGEMSYNGNTVIHTGNIGSQSVSYATTAGSLSSMNISQFTNNSGYLTSLPSHNHDDRYYTESESDSRYLSINGGTVTGWALFTASTQGTAIVRATQQDTSAGYYLFQGITGSSEVFRVERSGRLNSVEYIYSYGYRGNGNVGGTGTASWHPDGIYCGSTMWQYGAQYKNNTGIYDVSEFKLYSGPTLSTYNTRNLIVKAHDSNDVMGILGQKSGGGFAFQIYGDGTNYGFLDSAWGGWDIRKTIGGVMYMNNDNGYYLQTNSTSNFYNLNIQGNAVVHAGNIGSQSVSNSNYINSTRDTPSGKLQYWDAPGLGLDEAPSGDWHNTIRMGHGSPLSYYSNTLAIRMTGSGVGDIYTQTIMNGNRQGWKKHWNDGNHGSGSGLDADLLDGQQGSYYQPASSAITTSNIGSQSVSYASSAGSVAWTNVSSRPTALSQFTNDLGNYGGFLTSITAHTHSISDVSGLQTALDGKQAAGSYAASSHTHDDRYYTESESDTRFARRDADSAISGNLVIGNGTYGSSTAYGNSGARLMFSGSDGDAQGNYYIGTNHNDYGGNYSKLELRWHTGIRMGAQPGYGGIRFYDTEDLGTVIFSVGTGDSHVRVTNNLYVGGNLALHAGNYNSYSPTLTGGNASGTWGINVTGSAGSVAWTNVSSRPTNLSQFTNDLGNYGGFLTSITAHTHAISDVSGLQTALDGKQASGSYLTTSGKAADSELLDGIDSAYFVRGTGVNTLGYRTTNQNNGNSAGGLSSGFYDGSGMSNMPTSDWYHLIVNAHYNSATNNQYEFQLATAFWDKSNFYVRSISPGDVGPWRTLIHNGNIGSQSVNYANSAGSATSATTATTATVASQLNKFGDIYGQDWNSYYIQDKLIAAAVYGHSGANRPNLTYDYGVMLSYGETSGPVMQMYFPENSPNIGTIFRKATYRTGWNGNWSTWKTLVEQEGNTCTIVGGNQTGMEIHANVGYNQDPLTYFLLRGQADTSWKALKIRLTGDAGGQDIEFRRIAENGTDARMFYVPRGANQVIFDYQFVQGSDSRLKDNIIPITNSLDKVKSLRGVEFDWNSGVNEGTHDVGLIAQEVEAVLPEAVTTQEDGYKNLAYTKVIPLLVEAMKEQQAMIDALKAEIELLKNR